MARQTMQALVICCLLAAQAAAAATVAPPAAATKPTDSEAALVHVLSRAATVAGWLSPTAGSDLRLSTNTTDTIRMMRRLGVRYAGRSIYVWGKEQLIPKMLPAIRVNAARAHATLPDLILEGGIFEIVTKAGVEQLPIPPRVFQAFGLPVEQRHFAYDKMLFPDGTFKDHWGPGSSVPDLTQREAQFWFFYVGSSWILSGAEALHCGQIMLMSIHDQGMAHTYALFSRLRSFAAAHARRHFVLLNAHLFADPYVHLNESQQLIFDFHAFPSRPQPDPSAPENCTLNASFSNSICELAALPPPRLSALLTDTRLCRPALGRWRQRYGRLEDQVAAVHCRARQLRLHQASWRAGPGGHGTPFRLG
jgi:hypothetical protein